MYKIIVTLNNDKVIVSPTEIIEVHQELTLNLENELPKYLDYFKVYLEDKLSKLGNKIYKLWRWQRDRKHSISNTIDTHDC